MEGDGRKGKREARIIMLPGLLDIIMYRLQSIALISGSFFAFKELADAGPTTAVGAAVCSLIARLALLKVKRRPSRRLCFGRIVRTGKHGGRGRPPVQQGRGLGIQRTDRSNSS